MTTAPPIQKPQMPVKTAAAKPVPAPRMTLASVTKGVTARPHRVVLYGVEGVGKTTFAATAPAPIFIGTEEGSGALELARFPRPERWSDMLDAVRVLTEEPHSYRTLALDSLDWAEPLLWAHVCERDSKLGPDGKPSIEAYGFGKGYVAALDEARVLLAALETLQTRRGMHVVLIAHAHLKMLKNPLGEDFERYTLKVHEKLGGAVREWAETVLFANFETFTKADANERHKGFSTGRRLAYTTKSAGFEAKNRYALPEELDLSWSAFDTAVERNRGAERELRALVAADADKTAKLEAWLSSPRPIHEVVALRDKIAAGG